jgi:hypothetical protein
MLAAPPWHALRPITLALLGRLQGRYGQAEVRNLQTGQRYESGIVDTEVRPDAPT